MEKKSTAMQILRYKLKGKLDKESVKVEMFSKVHYQKGVTEALQSVINLINTEMLQIEREQFEDVYIDGCDDDKDAAKYFNETYKTE